MVNSEVYCTEHGCVSVLSKAIVAYYMIALAVEFKYFTLVCVKPSSLLRTSMWFIFCIWIEFIVVHSLFTMCRLEYTKLIISAGRNMLTQSSLTPAFILKGLNTDWTCYRCSFLMHQHIVREGSDGALSECSFCSVSDALHHLYSHTYTVKSRNVNSFGRFRFNMFFH